jgi:CRISPR-associated protein Cmr6
MPQFGKEVKTREYKISWRFVTNGGQDEGVIRPVIGAKGIPFYSGSSMKGAFLRVCNSQEALEYCGGEIEVEKDGKKQKETQPGKLRFHGGYPTDMSWGGDRKRLLDIVHSQWERQIKDNTTTSANVQISLYQPIYRFGISSTKSLNTKQWERIWEIWEQALAQGIGSRVSAGYGQIEKIKDTSNVLLKVSLYGEGLYSTLLNKKPEFRPNMFKAALRGHTLRLLAGVTDESTAQYLTQQLWGGITSRDPIVGQLGIKFTADSLESNEHEYKRNIMHGYELKKGQLSILSISNINQQETEELKSFVTRLIRFSLLLGGFGKSWRRVDHHRFFPEYFDNDDKPAIGCHWEFLEESERLYIATNSDDLSEIIGFLKQAYQGVGNWVKKQNRPTNNYARDWREAWHPDKVQVWGRIAKNDRDSKAIKWFHSPYRGIESIKNTDLTGKMGKIGRIWHRMYPRFLIKHNQLVTNGEYIELLTIFPTQTSNNFMNFLQSNTDFKLLFGNVR